MAALGTLSKEVWHFWHGTVWPDIECTVVKSASVMSSIPHAYHALKKDKISR